VKNERGADEKVFEQNDWGKMKFVDHMRKMGCCCSMQQVGCDDAGHP
jgi:hypothetical protein